MSLIHNLLQLLTVIFGLFVALASLFNWSPSIVFGLGLVSAVSALLSYFTGKWIERKFEFQIDSLERELRGRTLNEVDRQKLINLLTAIQEKSQTISLMGLQGNLESIRLANYLKECFCQAGFDVDGVWEDFLLGGTGPGIIIRQETADGPIGRAVCEAFESVGLQACIVALGANEQSNELEVIVGYQNT